MKSKRKGQLISLIAAAVLLWGGPGWAQDATWQGGTGNWNDTTQWDTGNVPGSTNDVLIDGGKTGTDSVANVNVSSAAGNLTIDAGDTVAINNAQTLTIHGATILNDGEIGINSTGSFTTLSIQGDTSLTGSGSVQMSNQASNRITGTTGSTLTHAADHSISGSGSLGVNNLGLINLGTIEADGSAGLTVNLRNDVGVARQNQGTMRALDGATLTITDTDLDNTGGVIEAQAGGAVTISGFNGGVSGGVLTGEGVINLNAAVLADLSNEARTVVNNAQSGTLKGDIDNAGVIAIDSTGSTTTLTIHGDTTLSGGGALEMSNFAGNRLRGVQSTAVLTNAADHTIRGAGQIGVAGNMGLINEGLIEAVGPAGLTVLLNTDDAVTRSNTGTMRATDGATLTLGSSAFDMALANAGGRIEAEDGGTVVIAGSRILGGTLDTEGTGVIDLRFGGVLSNLRNDGLVQVANAQRGRLQGTVENFGEISLDSSGSFTRIELLGDVTLSGSGLLSGSNSVSNAIFGSPSTTLTQGAGHTIRGAFNIGNTGNMALVNAGVIEAQGSAGITMSLSSEEPNSNSGEMRALTGSALRINSTVLDNTGGLIEAADGAVVTITGGRIDGGRIDTDGTGVIDLVSSAVLADLRNDGFVRVDNGRTGRLSGAIENFGTISIESTGSATAIDLNDNTTLSGTGELVLGDRTSIRLSSAGGDKVLTNAAGHTIRGGGSIGFGAGSIGLFNEGLIEADGTVALTINPNASLGPVVNTGTMRASGAGGLSLTGGSYDNQGLIEAVDGSSVSYSTSGITLNNVAGTLTDGQWRAAGNGSTIDIRGGQVETNDAEIILSGAGSQFRAFQGTGFVDLEDSLTSNQGTLRILDNRDYSTSNDLTNSGLLQLGGGTLDANSLTNTATGTLTGYGTVTPRPVNSGLIEATGGTLAMTGGIQGGSGTVTIQPDGALDLSSATQASSADFLNHQGTAPDSLNLGGNDFIVSQDYTNANFGEGNTFNARANVVGTGQIVGENADMAITGDVTSVDANTVTLDLGNVRGGTSTTVDYQIENTGSGADIRGAVQTAAGTGNLTDARLSGSGVDAQNFGPIAAGQDSGDLSVTFDATSGGSLNGQTIGVVSNFDNVAGQTIQITGMATSLAEGSATPAGPIDLGNFRVGQDGPARSFEVANLTTGAGAEKLGIGTADTTGNFAATNNLGTDLIDGGASQTNALSAAVNSGQAGVNTGSLDIQYTTDGTHIDATFTAQDVDNQSIALSATGYNMAQGNATPETVTLANQRVGGTESQALTVSNTAPSGDYTEGLNVAFGANTGEAVNNAGTIGLLAGDSSDGTSMNVGVDTTAAGERTGSVTLNYETDGTGSSGLAAESVGSQTITVSGDVYQVAEGNLNTTSLDFGVVQVGESVSQNLSISNTATGLNDFVEDLNAQFGTASGTGSNLISGSGAISGLLAGETDTTSMVVNVNTASAGTVNGAIAVDYFSAGEVNGVSNGLGTLAVGSENFGVIGNIETTATVVDQAAPVINTGQPILLGNVREGAVSPTAAVSVTNQATGNQQAALDATITGNAPITASGSFDDLGPGATDASSLQVGMNTATAGAIAGTATIAFVSDAENLGGGQLILASQDVQVQGAVYRLASPDVDTAEPVVLAARVGDAAPTQNLSVTNQSPDAFTEGLKADIGSVDAGFDGSGNIDNLAAEGTDATSLSVGLASTAASQSISGAVTLDFQSTGTGTTEAADISVGSEAVQVQGRVYQQAEAQVDTTSVDFGIVRVGDVVGAQSVSVTNAAPAVALNDTLAGGFVNLPAGPFDGNGSVSGLGAGQTDADNLAIGLDTSSAGIFDFSDQYLQFASQNPDMADLSLGTRELSLFAQVNNIANPEFSILSSGPGSLSQTGNEFVLDIGNILDTTSPFTIQLSLINDNFGPTDLLSGSFNPISGSGFTLNGFSNFSNLGAGDAYTDLFIEINPLVLGLGSFSSVIAGLDAISSNNSGPNLQFNFDLRLSANVAPIPEPGTMALLAMGLVLLGLAARRGYLRR